MDNDWNPSFDIEDALEQLPDCNISFSDYTRQIGNGFEPMNSSASVTTVDPICRLDLASMIAPLQPRKIGILTPANDDTKADEKEVTYWLRVSGLEAEKQTSKLIFKNTAKMTPIAEGKIAVSGVKNLFVDEDFFKLKAHPSQLLPFPNVLELPSSTDIITHQSSDHVEPINTDIQNSIITKSSSNKIALSKLVHSDKAAAVDTTIFYTPKQLYKMKRQQSRALKKAEVFPQNGF